MATFSLKVELKVGSTWTDVSSDVRYEQRVRITRGRSDWGQTVDASRCMFTLSNNDGRYTPTNPVGPHYGSIGRNTPCRVSVMTGSTYLDLPGSSTADYAETVDHASLDITGDIDVRLDATLANWLPPVGNNVTVEMIGKFSSTGQKSWFLGARDGRLYFEWSADGTNSLSASSTIPPVVPGSGRLAVRAWLDVDNGSGENTVTFYTADSLDSPWVQLGDPVTQTGTTSIFSSTSPLRIGNATGFSFTQPLGRCHAAEVRNGDWGPVVAQPRFDDEASGTSSFADSAGRTWTMNGSSQITNRKTRFVGEVSSWAVRWEDRFNVVCNVEASGITRRMSQGASPTRSPMYREFTNASRSSIVAYWPMEDEASATELASAFDGHPAMTIPATGVTPAAYTSWVASAALPTYSFGTSKVRLPAYTSTGAIFSRFFVEVPAAGVTGTDRLFSFTTTGTARTWSLFINTAGALDLRAYDADGVQILSTGFVAFGINGVQRMIGVELTQDGADVDYSLFTFIMDATDVTSASSVGTLAGYTCGAATEVRIGQLGLLNGTAVGHIAFADSSSAYNATGGAMTAWNGEITSARLYRLGIEELTPCFSASISEERMGVQGTQTVLELMREAEAADEAILIESREHYPGFRFRDHVSLYNQAPAMVLDYTGDDGLVTPLDPTDDDQLVRNDRTVQRTGGSSTRRTLDTGTLSTQAPPNGVGRYDDSVTRNVFTDAQTSDHAGWLLHLGTWDETRYPVVRIMLANALHLVEDAAAVDVGDRFHIANPPSWLPSDTIDLMAQGYTEDIDQFEWTIAYNCSPAGPWDVSWAGADDTASSFREFAWLDTGGSTLAEDLTTTETGVDVFTTTGNPWTPFVKDTPFDWRVAGEVMTVTAPGSVLNSNPFFDTNVTGWTALNSTRDWSQTYVHPHPRALGSMRITPDGVSAFGGATCAVTAVQPGTQYTLSMWVFSVDGWSSLQPLVDWFTSGGAYISSGATGGGFSVASSVWTYLEATFTTPATAAQAILGVRHEGSPAASDVYYVWAARITQTKASWLYDTFTRTSASGWGTSDSGLAWSSVGGGAATDYTTSGTYGAHVLATVDVSRRTGITAPSADFDIYCDVTTSAAATGSSLFGGITARMQDADNMYLCRLEWTTASAIILSVRKRAAGVDTQLGTYTTVFPHVAGTFVRVRFQGTGTSLKAKIWRLTDQEPSVWQIEATDSAHSAAQQIGTRSIRATGNTNAASVEIRYDNYEIVNPQTYTVTRSANRTVKAQSAGAPVALNRPARIAL
ncbi:carbohydrate binding domain-containing protein [Streptomyces sp. NBC_01373]|uniref:carbohydrate binding domain-containing protein n=1 Tax=Streptomyces sp. NBC_01373 TaxID=2903843 RepID=UPI00224CDF2B|nr:carbohydrate binding domain-containing protein [Streptomyces sp. NBC_01373]MCX4703858.1 hypothetical protein [Streptomyces sp. NBC_01373]